MAQLSDRTKPTHYRIVGSHSKTVFATAPASKAMQLRAKLQKQFNGERLDLELIEPGNERLAAALNGSGVFAPFICKP